MNDLSKIKQYIPKECFVKNPLLGTLYVIGDFFLWGMTYFLYSMVEKKTLLIKILYWLSSGFFMWCQFMNGHDCGHGSFSNSDVLNTIMGHVTHTPLLVPFSTWAESHRRHHLGHSHIKDDYSHPHIVNANKKFWYVKIIQKLGLYPHFGWLMYMLGFTVDGGHWIPFGGKLWNIDYSVKKHIHSFISSCLVLSWGSFVFSHCNYDILVFMEYYGASWLVFSWWLITVTYLQHHDNTVENTIVYGDESWTYLKGALQTVDRSYGSFIDTMTHNITDGHIVHHIFFTKIPHYHLSKATRYLYKYFKENNIEYKYRYTPFFFLDIYRYTISHLGECRLIK
jgi:omega-3 fatty acid desaturase (delta-15 desaturase)